ncbi:MAG: EAL domain-containing protein [Candidatus Aminicenantes bacterium]|nr:EAL domain-containing protein [Candidatus Aminicenantes bacterium]
MKAPNIKARKRPSIAADPRILSPARGPAVSRVRGPASIPGDPLRPRSGGDLRTWRKRAVEAEQHALAARTRLDHLLASSSGIIFSCRPGAGYPATFISDSVKTLLGYEPRDFLDDTGSWLEKVHPEDREELSAALQCLLEVGHLVHDVRMRHKDGSYRWLRDELRFAPGGNGGNGEIVGYWIDITESKSLEEQLLLDAFHDPLTNLANRALFLDRLGVSFARIRRRKNTSFALLCIDLDRFKNVNDSLGHRKGDQMLVSVARRLLKCVRFGDTVARLGGDEFAMLLEDINGPADVEATVRRIQREIGEPFGLEGDEVFATVSIGIAIAGPGCDKPENLLRDADTAMYRAKAEGKARHVVFDVAMRDQAVNLLQLETDLRRAVERNEFLIHYQPIVSLKAGEIVGFEALVRWQHPSRGLIAPSQFIPLAEDTGLIVPIGEWVLRESCRQMADWHRRFPQNVPLSISVNLSNKQLSPGFTGTVEGILKETGLNPSTLELEITESTVIENSERAAGLLNELRRMNVRILIDDFGTGYSTMNYLNKLTVDGLKIDRSFIRVINPSGEGLAIVRTILTLARNLGLDVIAEGVETSDQLELLRWLNGEYAQGFYFHEPLEPSRVEVILGSDRAKLLISLK